MIFDDPITTWRAVVYSQILIDAEDFNHIVERVNNFILTDKSDLTKGQQKDYDATVKDYIYPYQDGSFSSPYFSYYKYLVDEGLVTIPDDLRTKFEAWVATCVLGPIYPLEEICIVCQKPKVINMLNKKIHCESGPAISYGPDFNIFALNGVKVPEYLAVTPEEELDIKYFKTIKNAEVRTEFVRKFGIERMLDYGKIVDSHTQYSDEWYTKSQYELWDMQSLFEGINYAPHLKMTNQTTGIFHVEAVSPECKTIPEAVEDRIKRRNLKIKDIK